MIEQLAQPLVSGTVERAPRLEPTDLQLRRRQLLQRVVVELAHEALAFFLDHGGHVLEQHLPRAVDLGKPVDRLLQLLLGVPQPRDESGRQPGLLQDPRVFARKATRPRRVVGGDKAETFLACPPGHANGARDAKDLEHVGVPGRLVGLAREEGHVLEHHAAGEVVAARRAEGRLEAGQKGGVDPEATWNRGEHLVRAKPPEQHALGAHELTDGASQPAVEVRKVLAHGGVR